MRAKFIEGSVKAIAALALFVGTASCDVSIDWSDGGEAGEGATGGAAGSPAGGAAGASDGGTGGSADGGMSGSAGDDATGGTSDTGGNAGAAGDAGGAGDDGSGGAGGPGGAGTGGSSGNAGAGGAGTGGVAGRAGSSGDASGSGGGGGAPSCAVNNGGCHVLTSCTDTASGPTCGACPPGYRGDGRTGCVPNGCTGAPGTDCPCLKVTPDGDDVTAEASRGLLPFEHVQSAIDFAAAHRDIAVNVCVEGSPNGVATIYSGVGDSDFTMRDGISVYGAGAATVLAMVTGAGITFGPDVISPTMLSGFSIEPASTGITIDGALGARIADLSVLIGVYRSTPSTYRGIDARGAAVELDGFRVGHGSTSGSSQQGYGIQAFDSVIALRNADISIALSATSYGVWLENSPESVIENSRVAATGNSDGAAIRLVESDDVVVRGSTLEGGGDEGSTVHATDSEDLLVEDNDIRGSGFAQAGSGVWLERCPGSSIQGGTVECSGGTPGAAVRVNGDGREVKLHGVAVRSLGTAAIGILLEDCGGASPLVSENPSIVAIGGAAVGIRAAGDCHPNIQSNALISAQTTSNAGGSVTAVHCGAGSQCRILDNQQIRARGAVVSNPSTSQGRGILCEAGACAEISRNHIVGLERIDAPSGCVLTCSFGPSFGIDLSQSSPLVERNVVEGGCGHVSTGIRSIQGTARIHSNDVSGRSSSCDVVAPQTRASLHYGIEIEGAVDLHSNSISAGGPSAAVRTSCTSIGAWIRGPSSLRNNILAYSSPCDDSISVWSQGSVPPQTLQNNAFQVVNILHTVYRNGGTNLTLGPVNALPGSSANINLGLTSSTIDAGTTVGLPALDLHGNPRSQTLPDIGAVEWGDNPSLCNDVQCINGECHADGTRPFCICNSGYRNPPGNELACEAQP
jgi:hypothetical protein